MRNGNTIETGVGNDPNSLQSFYEKWSQKSALEIQQDIDASYRKVDVIVSKIPAEYLGQITSILDFGCGYGSTVQRLESKLGNQLKWAVGVDFSKAAIDFANMTNTSKSRKYYQTPSLDTDENLRFLESILPENPDCTVLVDLLEHVPNCKELVAKLATKTKYFLIKLPIESSVFDNYILPKEYPSSKHSNGHLREFDVNSVHYFIRQLGLTPVYESLYVYNIEDTIPPVNFKLSIKQHIIRFIIKQIKYFGAILLPKRLFLKIIGGGGYFCLATFDLRHQLDP